MEGRIPNEQEPTVAQPPNMTADPAPFEQHLRDANEQLLLAALGAQERAEESAVRYRDLVEGVDAIVWEASADPWQYTFVSTRAQAILGYPVERWHTEPNFWIDLIHPEDRAQAVSDWKDAASAKKDFRIDYRAIAKDGRIVWLAMIARLWQPEHVPAQFRGLLLDMGETVRAEMLQTLVGHQTAELLARQKQLQALATELTLSEYRERTKVATELHDHLSQLLVLGLIQLGQAKDVLGVAPDCGHLIQKTEDVLNQSLDYTRTLVADLSPPVLREFGLPAALRWLAEYMERYKLTVEIEAPQSLVLPITEAQGVLLFQSVRELLMNIAKHARIDRATVKLRCQPGIVRLEVQDAGCGFDPLYAGPSAVETHKTTPPTSSSFGLFAIRERMKTLRGTFGMESAPGKGTTATLTLLVPTTPELTAGNAVSSGQPSKNPPFSVPYSPQDHTPAHIRVLLVDDHAMLRQGLRSLVEGYTHLHVVGEASNGVEAIDAVRQLRPDVVVMDINMPQMNGIEATRRIKEEFPQTAVIGLSLLKGPHIAKVMTEAGICAYLTKESAVDELCHAIENAMKNTEKRV